MKGILFILWIGICGLAYDAGFATLAVASVLWFLADIALKLER